MSEQLRDAFALWLMERSRLAIAKSTGICGKCGLRVPKWFMPPIPELGYDSCLRCESGGFDPYVEPGQSEDDYLTRRIERHSAQRAEDEKLRLERERADDEAAAKRLAEENAKHYR